MSLLSTFFANHLIPALESALIAHEPDVQKVLVGEIKSLTDQVAAWVDSKLHHDNQPPAQ